MNVANLENCKELYELSGWQLDQHDRFWKIMPDGHGETQIGYGEFPAYDLGYLLRKIDQVAVEHYEGRWKALHMTSSAGVVADTPEDAACKLAIELFKAGVLERQL